MHKVLNNILPKQSIEVIFDEVIRFLTKRMEEAFAGITAKSKYGKKRIKVDQKYLQKNLQNINLAIPSLNLEEVPTV